MHIVAVDIGNSSTKFALAVPNRLENDLDIIRVSNHEFDVTENLSCFLNFAGPITWSICSVNRTIESMVVDWVSTYRCDDSIFAISESDIPIPSDIQCRKSLGTDRLLASWFSTVLTPRLPIVVVDSGTAVTIDVVNEDGVFAGGFIFPGIEKSLKVLNESTDALPDLVAMQANSIADYSVLNLGKSTVDAILGGVNYLHIAGLQGIVDRIAQQHPQAQVLATGGGLSRLLNVIPESWTYFPELVVKAAHHLAQTTEFDESRAS